MLYICRLIFNHKALKINYKAKFLVEATKFDRIHATNITKKEIKSKTIKYKR